MTAHDTPQTQHLPFDPKDMLSIRVTPAQFARMCGVSKQAVSGWKKRGIITIGPDGKLDPSRAAQQVIRNTDPARLRARVFKEAVEDHQTTRERAAKLQAEIDQLRETLRAERVFRETLHTHADDLARKLFDFCAAIEADFPALGVRPCRRNTGTRPGPPERSHVLRPDRCRHGRMGRRRQRRCGRLSACRRVNHPCRTSRTTSGRAATMRSST